MAVKKALAKNILRSTSKAFLNCDYTQRFFGAVYKCCVMRSLTKADGKNGESQLLTTKKKNVRIIKRTIERLFISISSNQIGNKRIV